MLKFLILSVFCLTSSLCCSFEYAICAKHEGEIPITKFFVYSERCAGSNFQKGVLEVTL